MKNLKLTFLLALSLLLVLTAACSTPYNLSRLSVLEVGGYTDSDDGGQNSWEYELWSGPNAEPHNDTSANREAEVSFEEAAYIGEYWYSTVEMHNLHTSDYYTFDGGWFAINHETGELELIVLLNADNDTDDKSFEDCKKIAQSLAEKYINLSQYTLTADEGDDIHCFRFVKTINGIKTCDELSIGVNSAGNIATFCNYTKKGSENISMNTNKIDLNYLTDMCTSQETMKLIDEKVHTIYPKCMSYEITDKFIVQLRNKKPAMCYRISVEQLSEEINRDEYSTQGSILELLVCDSNAIEAQEILTD